VTTISISVALTEKCWFKKKTKRFVSDLGQWRFDDQLKIVLLCLLNKQVPDNRVCK